MEKPLRMLMAEEEINKRIRYYKSILFVTKHSVRRKKITKELNEWIKIKGVKS